MLIEQSYSKLISFVLLSLALKYIIFFSEPPFLVLSRNYNKIGAKKFLP